MPTAAAASGTAAHKLDGLIDQGGRSLLLVRGVSHLQWVVISLSHGSLKQSLQVLLCHVS